MREIICGFLLVYILVMVARMIMSWIPPTSGGLLTVNRVLADLTEPVIAPVRRVIPPVGMFDLSFLVVFFGLSILRTALCP